MSCLQKLAILQFVLHCGTACLLVKFVLNAVFFKSLVSSRLQIVGKGLQWTLQIVAVLNFDDVLLIKLIVLSKQVSHIIIVSFQVLIWKLWRDDHPCLHLHELLAKLSQLFG